MLTNLAKFAAAAYQTGLSMNALMKANQELRQAASALTNANILSEKLNEEKLTYRTSFWLRAPSIDKYTRELDLLRASVAVSSCEPLYRRQRRHAGCARVSRAA